jgi:hypothetical protein
MTSLFLNVLLSFSKHMMSPLSYFQSRRKITPINTSNSTQPQIPQNGYITSTIDQRGATELGVVEISILLSIVASPWRGANDLDLETSLFFYLGGRELNTKKRPRNCSSGQSIYLSFLIVKKKL